MKIYRKIVFDYNFNIIEEDSYEYHGEIDRCDGGGGAPGEGGDAANEAGTGGTPGVSGMGIGGDASSQGMADAEANSLSMGGSTTSSSASAEAQAQTSAAAAAVAAEVDAWSSAYDMAKSFLGGVFAGMPAGPVGMSLGGLIGLGKQVAAEHGKSWSGDDISEAFNSVANTTTDTTNTTTSGFNDQSGGAPNAVWDGNSFVSPTSPTGKQAVAQAQSQGTAGATNMSNLNLEDQLKQEQLNILRKQQAESDQLSKLLYQSAGLVKDQATGEWRQATEAEHVSFMTDTEKQEYAIYKQQLARQQQALEGKLPISPALEREISDWDAQNKEALTRRLGTGYMTSTPGIQSENRQQERTGLLREEARRGELTAGSSRLTDWRTSLNNQNAQQLNTLSAIPNRTSSLLTGYQNALVPYTAASNQASELGYYANRDAQILAQDAYNQKQSMDARNKAGMWSTIGTLGGYLFS